MFSVSLSRRASFDQPPPPPPTPNNTHARAVNTTPPTHPPSPPFSSTMASALGRSATLGIRAQAANPAPRKAAGGAQPPRAPVSAAVLKTSTPAPPPVDSPLLEVDEASEPDAFAELVALNVKKQSVNRRQDVRGGGVGWRGAVRGGGQRKSDANAMRPLGPGV